MNDTIIYIIWLYFHSKPWICHIICHNRTLFRHTTRLFRHFDITVWIAEILRKCVLEQKSHLLYSFHEWIIHQNIFEHFIVMALHNPFRFFFLFGYVQHLTIMHKQLAIDRVKKCHLPNLNKQNIYPLNYFYQHFKSHIHVNHGYCI